METLTQLWAALSESGTLLLLRWSWQALLLLGGAWLAVKCYRSKAPALRHQLWLCALVAITILPFWAAVTRWVPVPQPTSKAIIYLVEMPLAIFTSAPEPITPVEPDTVSVEAPAAPFRLWPLLLAVWIVSALIALGRLFIFYVRLRRARMKAQPVSLSALGCADLDAQWPLAANIPIKTSPEVRSPILTGVLRPMILLPADLNVWTTAEERRAMLQHELAHFERRDHYVNCFQSWLSAIFFFHPLVRYACRQLHLERELACDDYVLSLGATPVAYAESLLKVAERNLAPVGLHEPAFLGSKKTLERRIEMIMNQHRPPRGAKRWPWLAAPVILLSAMIWLLVPVSGESMSQRDQIVPLVDAPDSQLSLLPPSPPQPWPPTTEDQNPPPPPPPPPTPAAQDKKDQPPPPPPPPSKPKRVYSLKRVPGGVPGGVPSGVPSGKGKKVGDEVIVKESKGVPGGVPGGKGKKAANELVVKEFKRGERVEVEAKPGDNPRPPRIIRKSVKPRTGSDQLPPPPPPPPKPTPSSTPKVIKDSGTPPPPSAPRVIRNDDSPLSVRVERPSARTVRVSLVRDAGKLPLPQSSL